MNPFLNLDVELNLDTYELRDLIDGRLAIVAELDRLGGDEWQNVTPENEARFNGLLARHDEIVNPEIELRNAANARRESRSRIHGNGGGTGQRSGSGIGEDRNRGRQNAATPAAHLGGTNEEEADILSDESLQGYSVVRGLRGLLDGRIEGFEAEVQQELEQRRGVTAQGLLIPWNLPETEQRTRDRTLRERRDATSSNWASTVPSIIAMTMIDVLRNRMVLAGMGATFLTDLIGTFSIPKKTATSSHYWVAEGSAVTESTPTMGQVAFAPETIGTFVDVTRRLLKQSSFAVEQLIRDDIMAAIAIGLDLAGVNGAGASNEPEGILQNASVPTVDIDTNGGALDWETVVNMETEVADDNADIGSLGYVFTPKGRGQAKRTEVFANTGRTIWNPDNTVNGYRAMASKQLPDNLTKGTSNGILSAGIFGNFADAVFGLWGGVDMILDGSTLSTSGGSRIVGLADADFQLRRAESFSKVIDINAAL